MRNFFLCLSILLFSFACSDNASTNNGNSRDASMDAQKRDATTDSQKDDAGSRDSGNSDTSDMTKKDASIDASPDLNADQSDSSGDVSVDLGDPFPGRPKGQCQTKSDCPDQPNANCGSIPGGVCLNCAASDSNCSGDAVCSQFGACIIECQNENECAPGLRCTRRGRCAAQRCQQGVCPIPAFGCTNSGLCERKDCSNDVNVCDNRTICLEGRCVLDR